MLTTGMPNIQRLPKHCDDSIPQAHFKPDTKENKVAWVIFTVSIIIALVLTPLGTSKVNDCARKYNQCVSSYTSNWSYACQPVLDHCNYIEW